MSTSGAVEQALCELERAHERVGYLLSRANLKTASQSDLYAAQAASVVAKSKHQRLMEVVEQHANAQYQAGLDVGRSEGLRAR